MASPTLPRVSVIVPVRDGADLLDRCLTALDEQDYPASLVQTIVVDNNSTENVAAVVGRHDGVLLLHEPAGGSYAARNTGLGAADGEVLAFTDGDCEPEPGWLRGAVDALREPTRVAMVGGAVGLTYPRGRAITIAEVYESVHAFRQDFYLSDQQFAVTANMVAWRSTFDRVGPFDGSLMSRGDAEWGRRVAAAGLEQRYAPAAVVRHPARSSLAEFVRKTRRTTTGRMTVELAEGMSRTAMLKTIRWQAISWARAVAASGRLTQLTGLASRLRYLAAFAVFRGVTAWVYAGGLLRTLSSRGQRQRAAVQSRQPA